MVCSVMEYLYTFSEDEAYGMAPVLFSAVNVISDLEKIDTYIKDCIRAAYTNKTDIYGIGFYPNSKHDYVVVSGKGRNVSANRVKTQSEDFLGNDLLRECGYVSLVHMYKAWLCGKPVYDMERMKMRNKEFAAYA